MTTGGDIIAALQRAVDGSPSDLELRVHLADLLIRAGRAEEAMVHLGLALGREPGNPRARELLLQVLGAKPVPASSAGEFDWARAETEVVDIVAPDFVEEASFATSTESTSQVASRPVIRLADVGGMGNVKKRLEASFLLPLRNPELSKLYDKSLRGGLLLYGPPGCGKTFIARAVAGELGAKFLSVSISDVLSSLFGESERNIHEFFQHARREAPCVLFIDEVDALGQRRTSVTSDLYRGVVNQLLTELDGVTGDNDGLFVLAATNQPWDVDPAMRRPGRLSRTLLVTPPDEEARREIFRHHLESRPVEGIELNRLAKASDGLSGADIAYVCELAAERAIEASVDAGEARLIGMGDLTAALKEVPASTSAWLNSARNFVEYGHEDPAFDELRAYLKKVKRL